MKKILLFIAAGLFMTAAQAKNQENHPVREFDKRFKKVQPVLFTYDQIDFAIFPDGHLEFEIPRALQYSRRVTNTRRSTGFYNNVQYNRFGQVTYINGTRVFYNRNGQVARIGRLDVAYYRGLLDRVGGLDVRYNKHGKLIAARGHVNIHQDFGYRHDCRDHDFGRIDQHHHDGYAQQGQDWDDGVYFKRSTVNRK